MTAFLKGVISGCSKKNPPENYFRGSWRANWRFSLVSFGITQPGEQRPEFLH